QGLIASGRQALIEIAVVQGLPGELLVQPGVQARLVVGAQREKMIDVFGSRAIGSALENAAGKIQAGAGLILEAVIEDAIAAPLNGVAHGPPGIAVHKLQSGCVSASLAENALAVRDHHHGSGRLKTALQAANAPSSRLRAKTILAAASACRRPRIKSGARVD